MENTHSIQALENHIKQQIIGQPLLINRMLIALLADGHLLVEGPPGLAKTRAIVSLSDGVEGDFHRIQFTPDLLPADITGTEIYHAEDATFKFQQGPLFHNLILADEINRAPAKVQSALLEAMAERQVTVGKKTYKLPDLFLVMATQNPIEQEGTYPLPEAQLDRFLMHINVDYPDAKAEKEILRLNRAEADAKKEAASDGGMLDSRSREGTAPLLQKDLFEARTAARNLYLADNLEEYIVQLTQATRQPEYYNRELASWLEYGVSPRATIALDACARAHAFLNGQEYVTPDNIQTVLPDIFRHRLLLSYDAQAQGVDAEQVIKKILQVVPVP